MSAKQRLAVIARNDHGGLTSESAAGLELLLQDSASDETSDWTVAAHFLLGLHYSDGYWQGGFPSKDRAIEHDDAHRRVIDHLSAFLDATKDPCLGISDGGVAVALPDLSERWWAAFGFAWGAWQAGLLDPRVPLSGDHDEIDLVGVALDRLALARYLAGEPKLAADSLAQTLGSPTSDCWTEWYGSSVDLTRLHGWIGWLYFDAGDLPFAADYLQRCFDALPHVPEEGSSPVEVAFIRLTEMYMQGGNCESSWRHAITDAGDGWNFLPSGTLERGCDAFLLRLAISCAAVGNYSESLRVTSLCIDLAVPDPSSWTETYAGYEPPPFPKARILRAALSVKLGQFGTVLTDVMEAVKHDRTYESVALALVCLSHFQEPELRRPSGSSEVDPFVRKLEEVASRIDAMTHDERRLLVDRCTDVVESLLNGSLANSGFVADDVARNVVATLYLLHERATEASVALLDSSDPTQIFGRRVIGKCSACEGEGRLWKSDTTNGVSLDWQEPCESCNGLGYMLYEDESSEVEPPF